MMGMGEKAQNKKNKENKEKSPVLSLSYPPIYDMEAPTVFRYPWGPKNKRGLS